MKIKCTSEEYKMFQDINSTHKIDEIKAILIEMGVQDVDFDITDIVVGKTDITNWLKQSIGKAYDGDSSYGPQCKDFVNAYAEWLGHPLKPSNAAETWDTEQDSFWNKIAYSTEHVPFVGDIVIWDAWKENQYGHIAVVLDASADIFRSVDQNWKDSNLETGSPATIITHDYKSPKILGYLRPSFES